MPCDEPRLRFLLDEHHPGWLAGALSTDGVDAVALSAHRPELRGIEDAGVLAAALAEGRVVVTEDVTTFEAAIVRVPAPVGVVYFHHARYPRTRPGLHRLRHALATIASDPPAGLGTDPVEWWLPACTRAADAERWLSAIARGPGPGGPRL